MFELVHQMLQDSAIALAHLAKFNSDANVNRRVADLSFECQVVVGNFQDQFQIRSRQDQALGGYEATDFRNVFQYPLEMDGACAFLQQRYVTYGSEPLKKAPIPHLAGPLQHATTIADHRVIHLLHIAQFSGPERLLSFDTLDTDLALQVRIRLADPDDAAEGFAAATFDGDNLPGFLNAAQTSQACPMRGDVIGAGHFEPRFGFGVVVGHADGQGDGNAFVRSVDGFFCQ